MTLPVEANLDNLLPALQKTRWNLVECDPRFKGKKGGEKHMLIRIYEDEIIEYYAQNGKTATMLRYGIYNEKTLYNLLAHYDIRDEKEEAKSPIQEEMEIWEYRMQVLIETSCQDNRDTRKEVRELREAFEKFQEAMAEELGRRLLLAFLQNALNSKSEPEDIRAILKGGEK
jgi:hypothetical protein